MPPEPQKKSVAFHTFLVLLTVFGIPILIALPFLLSGFIGQ